MRRSDSPQLQVCELACPSSSPRETTTTTTTGKMQTTIGKSSTQQQLLVSSSTPTRRNHPYRFVPPARQDSSPPSYYTLLGQSVTTAKVASPAASSHSSAAIRRPQEDTDQGKQSSGLPAGTIVAIIFSGLILIFLVTGVYAFASGRSHRSRRDWRGGLVVVRRRGHNYEDDGHVAATDDDNDMEMQAPRHTTGSSPLGQRDESQRQKNHQRPYHHDDEGAGTGAGMGYDDDDDDGKEAWIEVGTARVSRIRRVPAGSVAITNSVGRRGNKKTAAGAAETEVVVPPVGASQSVRDVFSLPDLAWAETLTTGGGRRRPGVMKVPTRPIPITAASYPSRLGTAATGSSSVTASATTTATGTALSVSSSRTSSSVRSSKNKKGLQERSESRRAVKRKAIREWCARGSGGGLGPYSAAY